MRDCDLCAARQLEALRNGITILSDGNCRSPRKNGYSRFRLVSGAGPTFIAGVYNAPFARFIRQVHFFPVAGGRFDPGNHHVLQRNTPELFAGFSRRDFAEPVRYPVACHPQAWAAGSVPFVVSSLLGITADAFNRRLRVIRPVLPGAGE